MSTLCIIQLAKLGDLIQTKPLLYLANRYFKETFLIVQDNLLKQAFPLFGGERVISISKRDIREQGTSLKRRFPKSFDLLINLNISRVSSYLANLVEAREKRGYILKDGIVKPLNFWQVPLLSYMRRRKRSRIHISDIFMNYLLFCGDLAAGFKYKMESKSKESDFICFQLGAFDYQRRWPVSYFAKLGSLCKKEFDIKIVLLGTKEEKDLEYQFFKEYEGKKDDVISLIGKTDLYDLKEILSSCALLVTSDTSTLHLASLVGTKTVSIFCGPASFHLTGPYGGGHVVLSPKRFCYPCTEIYMCKDAPCRFDVKPQDVLKAIRYTLFGDDIGISFNVSQRISEVDSFGTKYLPIFKSDFSELSKIALREALRETIRFSYRMKKDEIEKELFKSINGDFPLSKIFKMKERIYNLGGLFNDTLCLKYGDS